MSNELLSMSQDEMIKLGYKVVDMIVDHFVTLRDKPATRTASRSRMEREVKESFSEKGAPVDEVLSEVSKRIFGNIMHVDHPRYFAFIPNPNNFVSVMADALMAGYNAISANWLEASGPGQIEINTIDWLCRQIGLPSSAGGLFVSGGSVANLTALIAARNKRLKNRIDDSVVYYSDQTHSSNEKALRILGFDSEKMHKISSDDQFRLDLKDLKKAVSKDRNRGKQPFCVIANAGTTNTGAVDPLPELVEFCNREGIWLHVDGAYGASAVLCERGKNELKGLELVDSLSIDPHKWLCQPYEIGAVLVRNFNDLKDAFYILPEYLAETKQTEQEVNFCNCGIQLTRCFRALKFWMSLKIFGIEAFRDAVAKGYSLADFTQKILKDQEQFEIITPARMAIITFRYVTSGKSEQEIDDLNEQIVDCVIKNGFAMVSSTVLKGRKVLRMCTINPRTSYEDIRKTIDLIRDCGDMLG